MTGTGVVGGRYVLLDALDRRGLGPVRRAEDRITGRSVAVTEIAVPAHGDGLRERLLDEVRAAGRLQHPGVVGVLDLITDRTPDGALREYLVTEHPDARPLSGLVEGGPIAPNRAAAIGRDVLAALRAVHADGGTHGGLDPDCVLLAPDGSALVTDLGLARAVGRAPGMFAPPERRDGIGDSPAADLWSLGALLQHTAGRRIPPGGPLERAIAGLTAAEPADRSGPDEAQALLERAARPRPAGGDQDRNRRILLVVAGLLLVAVVAMLLWATR
ncbi:MULTISPECIES: protein kinase domain-containing protein [Pseudonocardia]|uniref:non-specific serine/threonine protein kinase n=2 Tax=Pseudonocardia TaxID=1847 RepID=A0A1Y2N0Z1_PSEAH|nr:MULTISPECIES: hypothetical protein [Pseudonocardia]OSY41100.1 Serine/threonine-protein kinase PknA [Pseudonocardia autotrophica]TDN73773.1 protein kinase-like protein [Pseudonocardia autotrophica]BBG04519.1 hypothetical protein Pdca_57280 [Pseudonocardia autotrophica]GEC27897.1 hypothetical protein PSA01_49260 [Pseudonocardia saturnea]